MSDIENAGSATAETEYQISMRSMASAVSMLQERLTIISQYMPSVDAGILPPDDNILSELKRITELLESLDSEEQEEKYNIMKLQAVMTYSVGSYTQPVETLVDFVRKNAVVIDKRGPGKGMRMGGSMFEPRFARGAKQSRPMASRLRHSFFGGRKDERDSNDAKCSGSVGDPSQQVFRDGV